MMNSILSIWNNITCVELPWYHRLWVELALGLFWFGCALVGGAIAMVLIITVPIWFLPYLYFAK